MPASIRRSSTFHANRPAPLVLSPSREKHFSYDLAARIGTTMSIRTFEALSKDRQRMGFGLHLTVQTHSEDSY
jgi:hypothetical protein